MTKGRMANGERRRAESEPFLRRSPYAVRPSPLLSTDNLSIRVVGGRTSALRPLLGVDGRARVDPLERKVLLQRMAVETLPRQDAAQVRVPLEADAEHVPGLPLLPVRR